jgi:predicted PurR-regulated permease PerM
VRPLREKSYTEKVFIAVGAVVATVLAIVLVYFTFDIILLMFAASLLAIFLRGLADLLRPYVRVGEVWLVLIVTTALLAALAGSIWLLAPSVAAQADILRSEIPQSAAKTADYIAEFSWGKALISQLPSIQDVMARIEPREVLTRIGGYFSSTVGAVGQVLVIFLLGIYLASEPRFYIDGFTRLFPAARRVRAREVLKLIYNTLRWWLIGKAASMLFIAVVTWIGLRIMGVPLALTLGIIAGLLSFIPNFGPIISALPALLLAFIDSPTSAIYVAALFIGIQIVESNIVTPIIERETVELPPALTVIFQLALAALIGGLGLILATPLLAVVVVLVRTVYIQDVLGEDLEEPEPAG